MDFYQEIRKQEALERIASKQGRLLLDPLLIAIPVAKPVKARVQRFREGYSQACEICGEFYRVRPSQARRRRTCAKPECAAEMRSLSRQKNLLWTTSKSCEYSGCNNTLNPRSKQKRFCSLRCARLFQSI